VRWLAIVDAVASLSLIATPLDASMGKTAAAMPFVGTCIFIPIPVEAVGMERETPR